MPRRTRLQVGLAVAALLAACAPDAAPGVASLGDSGAPEPSRSKTVDPEEARLAFAECMREHGVEMADPATGPVGEGTGQEILIEGDIDDREMRAADEACRKHLEGVFDEPSEQDMREMEDAALKFAECMRDNGVEDHPDPKFHGGGMTLEISDEGVMDDPDFKTAEEECRKVLPGLGSGGVERVAP